MPLHTKQQLIDDFVNTLDDRFNEKNTNTFSTGFNELDEAICGIEKGDLILFQGSAGSGKTALAINILNNLSHQGLSILYMNNGDKNQDLMMRLIALKSFIDIENLRSGYLSPEDWPKLNSALSKLDENFDFLFHSGRTTPLDTISQIRFTADSTPHSENECELAKTPDFIIIDDFHMHYESRSKQTKSLLKLKDIADNLEIPIVVFSSNSPTSEKQITEHNKLTREFYKEPVFDCVDLGIIIQTEHYQHSLMSHCERSLELAVIKNKRGRKTFINLDFSPIYMMIK